MPDLNALYPAISDENATKVKPFIEERKIVYPILLDAGDTVHTAFAVEGIPKSFLYDRLGKAVAQAIDMRARGQLLEVLSYAGLR